MKTKYTINICLAPHVWSKPIELTERKWLNAYKEFFQLREETRIEEDDNWKLVYHIFYASGKTDAMVVFCREEHKRGE